MASMDSVIGTVAVPSALAVIMLGLGLTLTVGDFVRISKHPKPVLVALACQLLVLPVVAFGLAVAFDLKPTLAIGLMLLAASPGGTTANVLSHFFKGDVALNISLTAVNSVLAIATLPIIANLAIGHFGDGTGSVGLQFGKTVQVFAFVLVPVVIGVLLRHVRPVLEERAGKLIRVGGLVVLVVLVTATLFVERGNATDYALQVGVVSALFCLISLTTGYFVPRLFGVRRAQAIACSMEIGIHNSGLAIAISISLLGSTEIGVPAAVYSAVMWPLAVTFGLLIMWRSGVRKQAAERVRV